jgi:hypothetical protein
MSIKQYPGGIVTKNPTAPTTTVAKGIWTLDQVSNFIKQSTWPRSPGAPTIGTATVSVLTASVPFTAPTDTGSVAITNYIATSTPGNVTGTSATSPISVTGLTANTSYTFQVQAINGAGTGAQSAASNSVTTASVPGAPTIGTATVSGLTASVPFTAPASDGGSTITTYTATSSPSGITGTLSQAGSGTVTVSGLAGNTTYTFTVTATNVIGTGAASAASNSVTSATVPGAPTIGTATATTPTAATVTYTAPASDGGSAITLYTATSSPGSVTGTLATAGSGTITVTGLTTGTAYTFTVKATNVVGQSAASASSNSVTPALPAIGTAYEGGFFAGQYSTTANGVATHNLVVGPKSTAETSTQWKTSNTATTGANSPTDGIQNTDDMIADGGAGVYPAAGFCYNLSTGGKTDWYMPSQNEIEVCYYFLKPTTTANNTGSGSNPNAVSPEPISTNYTSGSPAQTSASDFAGGTQKFEAQYYWTSTQYSATHSWFHYFLNGRQFQYRSAKNGTELVRAIRRVAV